MNVSTTAPLHRRTLLRGAGAAIALPWLEAMVPAAGTAAAKAAPGPPPRLAWVYIPNGVVQDAWHPRTAGPDWEATPSLAPLADLRRHLNLYTGLDREFRGGTGVHAQAGCCWLSSSPPAEALDGGFPTNRTLDQIVASQIGRDTPVPSLHLSCNDHANQRETRYFESVSWRGPGNAAPAQKDPRQVFDRLFGKLDPSAASVLDVALADAKRLRTGLGRSDRQTVDGYLQSVRELEKRVQRAGASPAEADPHLARRASSVPEDRGEYLRLMGDLIVAAFRQDRTRVATLLVDPERWDTPRLYHGVFDEPQNHHALTHTKGDEAKEKLARIDRFHVEQFAHVVRRLAETPEAGGSLLDNCLISLGSGMGDGRVHDYGDLPLVTAGGLGGRVRTGAHHKFEGKVPLANLWLSVAQAVGVEADAFADSDGTVTL
ncbi:DUF1552 domain-containing protein [Alienimonas sp. DA493]|uniref:DUF1552 domain-containing protein n=1 Tax=Alienimonas sp. DA493 TaxID=3373605 RepID=UPI003753E8C7